MADGTIPKEQQDLLLAMGAFLKQFGTAIYETRAWSVYGEGPTKMGGCSICAPSAGTAQDVRYTTSKKGDVVYAILLGWPGNGKQVDLTSVTTSRFAVGSGKVFLFGPTGGSPIPLTYTQDGSGLHVTLPSTQPYTAAAYAMAISPSGTPPAPTTWLDGNTTPDAGAGPDAQSDASGTGDAGSVGTGGNTGTGGRSGAGGAGGSTSGQGGAASSGGAAGTGGVLATGGRSGTGGTSGPSTGGSAGSASGGSTGAKGGSAGTSSASSGGNGGSHSGTTAANGSSSGCSCRIGGAKLGADARGGRTVACLVAFALIALVRRRHRAP